MILITVCRRYFELQKNIKSVWARAIDDFSVRPEVVVVWARPEASRRYFFRQLHAQGLVQHVLERPALDGEADGCATTYPESHNIRLGLEFIKKTYGPECLSIVQSADICPKGGTYWHIENEMKDPEANAFVCFFGNGCCHDHIWHTNFFAVRMKEAYWPPLAKPGDQDILERMWGLSLQSQALPGLVRWSNPNNKWFSHDHEDQLISLPPWYARLWYWLVYGDY